MPTSPSQFLFQSGGGGANAFTQLSGNPLFTQIGSTYSIAASGHAQLGISGPIFQWTAGTASAAGNFVSWPRTFTTIYGAWAQTGNQLVLVNVNGGTSGCTLTCTSGTPACNLMGIGV